MGDKPRSTARGRILIAASILAAAAAGSATAALVVGATARAKGTLSGGGVSVDEGGAVTSQTGPSVMDAVIRDVLGRVRCDPPTTEQCADPVYLASDCGRTAQRALATTGTSECADFCAAPTLAECRSEDFLATLCGQLDVRRGRVPLPAACTDSDARTLCPASPSVCHNLLAAEAASLQTNQGSVVPDAPMTTVVVPSSVLLGPDATPQERARLDANGYAAPEVTTTARSVDPDWSDFATTPPGVTYFSRLLEEAAASQAPMPTLTQQSIAAARTLQRSAWNGNGNVVTGCAEYVYEKYYDYTVFENARRGPGMTARQAWDIAYAAGSVDSAIGTHGVAAEALGQDLQLRQRDGTLLPVALTFQQSPQPKNEFFATPVIAGALRDSILQEFQQNGSVTYTFKLYGTLETDIVLPRPVFGLFGFSGIVLLDDDLTARLDGAATVQEGWTYHQARGQELPAALDEQMLAYDQLRDSFVPLLTRWTTLASDANSLIKSQLPKGEVLINDVPFDPTIFESVVRATDVSTIASLSTARSSVDAERALVTGDAVPESSGLLGSLSLSSLMTGGALTNLMKTASGPSGTTTAMSGTFSNSILNLSQAAQLVNLDQNLLNKLRPALGGGDSFIDRLGVVLQELAVVSGDIEAALLEARDRACLETTVTPCDWSPQRFLQRVSDQFQAERERDFQACLRLTTDDFAQHELSVSKPGRFLVTLSPLATKPRTDAYDPVTQTTTACDDAAYDTSPTRFERWQRCFGSWRRDMLAALAEQLANADMLVNPDTGKIEPSESSGGDQGSGDDLFAVGFEYGIDWRLTGMPQNGDDSQDRWCALEPQVHGHAQMDGKILGFDIELAEARIDVDTRPGQGANNRAYIEVGGEELISVTSEAGAIDISKYNLIFEETTTNYYELFSFSQTFPVGPVWINVAAGAVGTFGAHLIGAVGRLADQGGDCASGDLGLEGKLVPFVGFSAFASAGVDYLIVSAGVKITLTLVRLSFPFSVALTFEGQPQAGNPDLVDTRMVITNNLDVVLSILDGRVSAFVEVCFIFCEEFEATLFEWEGPRWVWNLFHTELEVPLGTLVQFQQSAEQGFSAAGN